MFKTWTEAAQAAWSKGRPPLEGNLYADVAQRLFTSGTLTLNSIMALQQAFQATSQGEEGDEALHQLLEKASQTYWEWYQTHVGKYLTVPQLGLNREALQQILGAVDAYHRFMGIVGDFGLHFSLPYKKSLEVLFEEIKDRDQSAAPFENAQELIQRAVAILEKTYDDYLKSAEGQKSVIRMVESYLEFKEKTDTVLNQVFRALSLPTKKEMEDVYQRLHGLRKKVRKQEALIQEQAEGLKGLNQKIKEMEASLSAASPKGQDKTPKPSGRKTKAPRTGT